MALEKNQITNTFICMFDTLFPIGPPWKQDFVVLVLYIYLYEHPISLTPDNSLNYKVVRQICDYKKPKSLHVL